jgi:hypothetical protein
MTANGLLPRDSLPPMVWDGVGFADRGVLVFYASPTPGRSKGPVNAEVIEKRSRMTNER